MENGDHKKVPRWYFGGLAGAMAVSATHPLDLLKVHLQTHKGGKTSLTKMAVNIVKADGVLALYSGISAAILRQLTYSTARFSIYEAAKQATEKSGTQPNFASKMGFAGIGGVVGGFIGTPSDLVNVRMQNDMKLPPEKRRNYKNVIDGLIKVSRKEGVMALFSGGSTASIRAALMNIGQLSFYDQIKLLLLEYGQLADTPSTHFLSSSIAAIFATTLTQPLDVVKTLTMNAKPGEFKGVFDVVVHIAKLGPTGFFKGYVPSFMRVAPTTILVFVIFEQLRLNFGYIPSKT